MTVLLPHPVTGQLFASPVPPGLGWPQDPATAATPAAQDAAAVASAAQECRSVEQVAERVSVCRACPRLVAWREQVAQQKRAAYADQPYWGRPAPSFGDPRPGVLIVGLAPAAHGANRTGRMFTGDRSGDWLYAALHRSGFANQASATAAGDGLVLHGIRITAGAHCAPPQNKPSISEKRTCAPWLERELELLTSVRAIVALGGIAWETTLSAVRQLAWTVPRPKARFGHGAEVELGRADGGRVTLFGCYHVSQQNTFTGRLTEPMLDDVLRSAGRVAGQP